MRKLKTIIFYIDGMADEGETPLKLANKPFWNKLASRSLVGTLQLLPEKIPVWSHYATISLLGYDVKRKKLKRGVLEAIGSDYNLKEGHLAVRCNFATIENGIIIDRRAGRDDYGLKEMAEDINRKVKIKAPFDFFHTSQHRSVLVIKMNLSDEVRCNDPLEEGKPPIRISALKKDALHTAKLLNDFLEQAKQILAKHPINKERRELGMLPANYLLMRDPGNKILAFPRFLKRLKINKAVSIAERGVVKAVFLLAGFKIYELKHEDSIEKYIANSFEALEEVMIDNELAIVHLKKCDELSHDRKRKQKIKFFEIFDKYLQTLENFNGKIVITGDHITSSITGKHMHGPVPFMIYNPKKKIKGVKNFHEKSAQKTKYQNISGKKFWKLLYPDVKL